MSKLIPKPSITLEELICVGLNKVLPEDFCFNVPECAECELVDTNGECTVLLITHSTPTLENTKHRMKMLALVDFPEEEK